MKRIEIWNKEDWERRFDTEPYVSGVDMYCDDPSDVRAVIELATKSGNVCVVEQIKECKEVEQ